MLGPEPLGRLQQLVAALLELSPDAVVTGATRSLA